MNNVIVYPNPTKDIVNIQYKGAVNIAVITLLDINGRILPITPVYSESEGKTTIDLTNLSAGVYTLKVVAQDMLKTIKVIKK